MDELRQFCYNASFKIMQGLSQELNIYPKSEHRQVWHYIPSGYNSARVMTLRLSGINPHYLKTITPMANQLTMWAGLPQEHRVRISYSGTNIFVEIPKPPKYWKQITLDYLQDRHLLKRNAVTLGLGLQDQPIRINFNEPDIAHLLIAGQTRSGKTNTQQLIAYELCKADAKLIVIDIAKKVFKWGIFSRVTNLLYPLCTDIVESEKVLSWADGEMNRRANGQSDTRPVYILVDELKSLIDFSEVSAKYLAHIAAVGGEFGLHLILSTQYPQINMLGSAELKRNVGTRLCGKVDDGIAAANILGVKASGAETLQGYGDFLLKDNLGLNRLTIARIEDRHIEALPKVEHIEPLEIPDNDIVYAGPQPAQVASALFEPTGINKLAKRLGVGNDKATAVKQFAEGIKEWAIEQGYRTSMADGFREFYFRTSDDYDPRP